MNKKIFVLSLHFFIQVCTQTQYKKIGEQEKKYNNDQFPFVPYPKQIDMEDHNAENQLEFDPCLIEYNLNNIQIQQYRHFQELIEYQQLRTFHCHTSIFYKNKHQKPQYLVDVQVSDPTLRTPLKVEQEIYSISISKEKAIISAKYYPGFVRALETLMQAIQCPRFSFNKCKLIKLPIHIEDSPTFPYRSLMIDTSRHFLPMKVICQTVDALMYNKMNVLHWHITDQDSFPLVLNSHPQMAEFAAFSKEETYDMDEVKQLIHYAMVRGVRVVPEIDTPGHSGNWDLAPTNIHVSCMKKGYIGGLDITLSKTYKLLEDIFKEIVSVFPDPLLHVGGDQFQSPCFMNLTQFAKAEGINDTSPFSLQKVYQKKLRQMIKSINSTKRLIFWARNEQEAKLSPFSDEIIQWWPNHETKTFHEDKDVILSIKYFHYYSIGSGNKQGRSRDSVNFATWIDHFRHPLKEIIQKNGYQRNRVMGSELTLWSENSNMYTHHTKIWIRGSAFADDLWGTPFAKESYKLLGRITAHERLLNRRGISTSPATSQYCQFQPINCDLMKGYY